MQGPKKGQIAGRPMYAINCLYEENEKLGKVYEIVLHQKPKWFKDWGKWSASCPTKEKALMLHEKIKEELPLTGKRMNGILDVTPYDHPACEKFKFTLCTSELQFETRTDGILPRSIMVCIQGSQPHPHLQPSPSPSLSPSPSHPSAPSRSP